MPVIAFASCKGGVGRTTSAIVLATTLVRNHKVTIIDADPAARLVDWARQAPLPGRLKVLSSRGERFIQDEIEEADGDGAFVIVDLEGALTRLNAYVMGQSDLVVIPMGDEQQDAKGAIETLAQVSSEAKHTRREIPVRILFARTEEGKAKSGLAKSINEQVRARCNCFTTELRRLPAFSWLHNMGGTLYGLDPQEVEGLAQAIACTELLTEEVVEALPSSTRAEALSGQDVRVAFSQSFYARLQSLGRQEERSDREMLEVFLASYTSKAQP